MGCEVAAVLAVIDVESRGGFLDDGRPKILFERHVFSRETKGKFDRDHPDLSAGSVGGHKGGAAEYERLHRAMELDRDAALRSASWGAFQIMGYHHGSLDFETIGGFCDAMCDSEDAHLNAFVRFVIDHKLDDELR